MPWQGLVMLELLFFLKGLHAWALSVQIRSILSTLVDVLRTPSSDVQRAVSECLEPLMTILVSDESFIVSLIDRIQGLLLKGASYGDRSALCTRGSQYPLTDKPQRRCNRSDVGSQRLPLCMSPICHVTQNCHVLHRRGAAFGLAGMIKGLGISAINKYGTMDALKKALDDQTSADAREGALFAFECLCEKLGR